MSEKSKRGLSVDAPILHDPMLYLPSMDPFCPPTFHSDLMHYIEVGQIKISTTLTTDDCQFVELWVSSCLGGNKKREECKSPKRRQIYSVLCELEELCAEKDTCVLIMDDDGANGTDAFYNAIYPIVVYLQLLKSVKAVILFTTLPQEKILMPDGVKFLQSTDRCYHETLYNTVDAYVTDQSNCYDKSPSRRVKINNKKCSVYVSLALNGGVEGAEKID
ncbi:MAG: hypothetical protein E7675_04050 [Ruminococcaceae bacterium]|nr:hypothetical protein [Oscillospiraceae bacterium]